MHNEVEPDRGEFIEFVSQWVLARADSVMPMSRIGWIAIFTGLCVAAAFLCPAMPQPLGYHHFADQRALFGVPNLFDVASNIGFFIAGAYGLFVTSRPQTQFVSSFERIPYVVFFVGMLLTALGSSYYHLAPDNERLFWDRLPMTIAFMSLIAAQICERVNVRAGIVAAGPMLAIGAVSVVYWRATERAGEGNVIPYGILQGYSVGHPASHRRVAAIAIHASRRYLLGVCMVCHRETARSSRLRCYLRWVESSAVIL